MFDALLDLVLPLVCGGCGRPDVAWCRVCARELIDPPAPVHPRVDPEVPVWALGSYSGPRARAVVAAKERGRRDLAVPLGLALAVATRRLRRWGALPPGPLTVVPAPTRARAARARGGDPVARMVEVATKHDRSLRAAAVLSTARGVRDSVGLTPAQRQRNLAGRIRARPEFCRTDLPVLLVDDIVTTGATAAESVRVLARAGFTTSGILTIARA